MRYVLLFNEALRKESLYLWRYKLNLFAGVLFLSLICVGILFGAKSFSPTPTGGADKLAIIAGYIIWVVMVTNFQTITRALTTESTLGTFEQVFINATSMTAFLVTRCAASFVLNIATLYSVLVIIMLFSQVAMNIGMVAMLPVIALGVPAVWGLGIGIGSLVLFAKQIESLSVLLSTIAMAAVPVIATRSYAVSVVLPFGLASRLSQALVTSRMAWSDIAARDILLILLNDGVYLLLGLSLFAMSCHIGRKFGELGAPLTRRPRSQRRKPVGERPRQVENGMDEDSRQHAAGSLSSIPRNPAQNECRRHQNHEGGRPRTHHQQGEVHEREERSRQQNRRPRPKRARRGLRWQRQSKESLKEPAAEYLLGYAGQHPREEDDGDR